MKLLLLAFGSRGDVQPLLPLGVALRAAGYGVQIAAGTNFKQAIETQGLAFVDVGVDVHALMNSESGKEWTENSSSNPLQEARNMKRIFDEHTGKMGAEILRISTDADVLISNLPTFGVAHTVAELLGKKHIRIMLAPLTPTSHPDATMVPIVPGRNNALNRLAGYLGIYFTYWINRESINTFRRGVGRKAWNYGDFARAWNQMPVLYGVSPRVMPPDPKWNRDTVVTGYWFDTPDERWQPPAPLENFLQKYPAPVYIGFGSMGSKNPKATLRTMVDALRQTGQPGILYSGWAGLATDTLPENVLLIDGAPHDWLFPRMAAIIHHGGAGTTAAALRAGIPSTVVPHMADQPYWGRRVYELGVGHKPIPRHELSVERLAEAITVMVGSPTMQAKAAALGAHIRQERDIENAINAVNAILRR
jgi:UDP:flavonoid glycosyltransferase YjiC (YdhE family)